MKTFSIIIPVVNESAALRSNLPLLQTWRRCGHEVIVIDGGSCDDSMEACAGLVDDILTAEQGRARQMNAGAARAKGDVLLFLHIDTLLPDLSTEHLLKAMAAGRGYLWGRFDVRLSGQALVFRVIEAMMNLRSRITGVATGDQAIFVHRRVFEMVGGFADIPLMEDVLLSKTLLRQAGRPLCIDARVVSSSRRWEKHGIARTVVLMWWLRLALVLGIAPARLHAQYYGKSAANARHPR